MADKSGYIPREFIDRLVSESDIVSVLGNYVKLTKRSNNFVSCCPFHEEKTPSFTVSPQKSIYHCFGCSAGGNVLTFLQEHEGLTFVEAVEKLAEINNVEIPRNKNANTESFDNIFSINEIVSKSYHNCLKDREGTNQSKYLLDRGFSQQIIKSFFIGFAEGRQEKLISHLKGKFSEDDLVKSGAFMKGQQGLYPFFRNRITFPIKNLKGKVIGFGGRSIDEQMPKYLNSKDSKFFRKSFELFGLDKARSDRDSDFFLLTEGYTDVVMLNQFNISNAIASLGTSFTDNHLRSLFKYKNKVVFCFDSDEAGLKAAWRACKISLSQMRDDKTVRFLFLPKGYDPDSFVKEHGKKVFMEKAQKSMEIELFVFNYLKRGKDLNSLEDIRLISHEFRGLLKGVKSEILKETLARKLSLKLDIKKETLIANESDVIPVKSTPKINNKTDNINKSFILLLNLYENYQKELEAFDSDFITYLNTESNEDLVQLRDLINSMKSGSVAHKESNLYAQASLLELNLNQDEIKSEFFRSTDDIRFKFDKNFLEFLEKEVRRKNLSMLRKENLQKEMNLVDNVSNYDEELIKLLNSYS